MSGQTDVAIPNAGVGEMAHALGQRRAVRSLDDLGGKANSGNMQTAQGSVRIVAVLGHIRIANAAAPRPGAGGKAVIGEVGQSGAVHAGQGGVVHIPQAVDQPAVHAAGGKVGGQVLAGVGEVAGGRSETGRHPGGGLAPVRVLIFFLPVNDLLGGGLAEQIIVRSIKVVLQGAGRGDEQCHQQRRNKQGLQIGSQLQVSDLLSLIFITLHPPAAKSAAMPPAQPSTESIVEGAGPLWGAGGIS